MSPLSPEEVLDRHFGHASFRPGQREAIEALLAGRDAVAVMPTGSGKSLCYQVPALVLEAVTLVVSPLIALMKDQVDSLVAGGIPATFVNSSISWEEQASRLSAMERGAWRLVYVAPERFRSRRFQQAIARTGPAVVAVDEAHCISQWGHDFRPDYLRLGEAVAALRPAAVLACTATATPEVRDDIARHLGMADPVVLVRGFRRENLFLDVEQVRGGDHKVSRAAEHLRDAAHHGGSALVYCATRRRCEQVAEALRARDLPALPYHAGMEPDVRRRVQERFMADEVRCVVATTAFGMGVDKPDVRLVVHHDLPRSPEAYYQEVGRAGRDGRPSRCVLLYNHGDTRIQEFLIDASHPPEALVREVWGILAAAGERVVDLSLPGIVERCAGRAADVHVRSALGILEQAGALERGVPPDRLPDSRRVLNGRAAVLSAEALATGDPPVDFPALRRRAERERGKLGRMVLYCTGVQCRHRFLLDWFGDPEAAACGDACDCCVASTALQAPGATAELTEEQVLVVRKALSAVARLHGRFGVRRVAQVLAGSRDRKLLAAGLDRLPTHGALSDWSQDAVVDLLHSLMAVRCLEVLGAEYPTVSLTEVGRDVMHDRSRLGFPWPASAPGVVRPRPRRATRQDRADVAAVASDPDLFERLRAVRGELARENSVPAYVVAPDRSLHDLAVHRPRTVGELLDCHGFGTRRAERFGEPFLLAIREHEEEG